MPRRYTPEMAVDLRVPSELALSPDGSQLLYRVEPIGHRTTDRTSTIFVVPADGSAAPRALTGSDHNNASATWSPDGATIAFLSDRSERGTQQLHVIPAAGGEPLRLTELNRGVSQPTFAPDGRSIAFIAQRRALAGEADPSQEIRVESELGRPRGMAHVPVVGGPPRPIGPMTSHVWSFAFSPDGKTIAAFVSDTEELAGSWDNARLVITAVDGSNERELLRMNGFPGKLTWFDDGRRLAVIGSVADNPYATNVYLVDVVSGQVTVLDDRGMTPNAVLTVDRDLLVHSAETQHTRIDRYDPGTDTWEPVSLGPQLADAWVEARGGWDARAGTLTVLGAFADHPANVYAGPLDGDLTCLTDLNPHVRDVDLSAMEPIEWQSSDGLAIHGWLMLPPGADPAARYPLAAAIHGGPSWQWGSWFHGTWHDWGQLLTARGYAVFMPNPRGSTGRGAEFSGVNHHDFGGGDFDDIMTGIDMLIERGVADPDRLGICGWSFGGFMAAWAVGHTDRFKASIAGAACINWVSKIGTTDIRPFDERDVGAVNTDPDRPWKHSPLRYAGKATTPTLMLHGQADVRVPVTQATEFYNALKAAGVATDMVSYPRQGHAFHERAFQLDLLQRLIDWLERYLGPGEAAAES